jgi:hypothetical protein
MALARISVTVPPDLVEAADRRAAELGRSRSWLVVQALRGYLAARPTAGDEGAFVREAPCPPYAPAGLDAQRRAQLEADLALTPEQRVREAEATARLSELGDRPGVDRLITFDRYEDYLAWERWAELTPP